MQILHSGACKKNKNKSSVLLYLFLVLLSRTLSAFPFRFQFTAKNYEKRMYQLKLLFEGFANTLQR